MFLFPVSYNTCTGTCANKVIIKFSIFFLIHLSYDLKLAHFLIIAKNIMSW